ncbi:MAG: 4-phosphoerythronate dehydrogenase [Bacteroidaceae bacterium]|nr:4-phosphoerythronate dehydrogenase [Bacteroidaceae bacterium]
MKVVIDEKIPYLRDALVSMGVEVLSLPGVSISNGDLLDADALFVRTRTKCNRALLEGTGVRFIGTATIGYDHVDAGYCCENGITWTNAAGCNAGAVLQYVQSVIYSWARDNGCGVDGLTLGVVGLGEIGSRVASWAAGVGMNVLANDPPKADAGMPGLVSLAEIAAGCDIITFHPTLNMSGLYRSFHLADESFFASLCRCKLLINASRGEVVDDTALLSAMEQGLVGCVALDVWESEPEISIPLLNKVYIATPHIAGYSAEGKRNATSMVLDAFSRFIGYKGVIPELELKAPELPIVKAATEQEALLSIYSPLDDTVALRNSPSSFENLRNSYKLRREPSAYKIEIAGKC